MDERLTDEHAEFAQAWVDSRKKTGPIIGASKWLDILLADRRVREARLAALEAHVLHTNGLLLLAAMHKEGSEGDHYLDDHTKEECRAASVAGQELCRGTYTLPPEPAGPQDHGANHG